MIATDRTGGTPGLRTLEETADSSVYSIEKHRYQNGSGRTVRMTGHREKPCARSS